jgi:dolichyl-phosphate mannosyltransferase polypeptide 2 regulatory subunit
MVISDRIIGVVLLLYYSTWILIVPFFEPEHVFHKLFFDRYIAIVIAVLLLTFALTIAMTFIGLLLIRTKEKMQPKYTGNKE